jgi:hypothetical protein
MTITVRKLTLDTAKTTKWTKNNKDANANSSGERVKSGNMGTSYKTDDTQIFVKSYPTKQTGDSIEFLFMDTYNTNKEYASTGGILGSVTLYQPGGIKSDYNQNWDDGTGLHGSHGSMDATTIGGIGGAMVGGLVDVGIMATTLAAKTILQDNNRNRLGKVINPFKGVTFSAPNLRSQSFTFVLLPKTETEVKDIIEIIHAFKYFSSPGYSIPGGDDAKKEKSKRKKLEKDLQEKKASSVDHNKTTDSLMNEMVSFGKKFMMDYPCTFKITFNRNLSDDHETTENTAINKFGPAVLTGLTIDYSPGEIWRTFRNGFPVNVTMSLTFKEMEIKTKESIAEGY